jgi:hypothetical protein
MIKAISTTIASFIKKVQTSTELLRAAGEILMFPNNQKVLILSKH